MPPCAAFFCFKSDGKTDGNERQGVGVVMNGKAVVGMVYLLRPFVGRVKGNEI